MKRLTIRTRIIVWYTLMLLLILCFLLAGILIISERLMKSELCEKVKELVDENAETISVENGRYIIGDSYKARENGIVCLTYDTDGTLLAGKLPDGIRLPQPEDGRIFSFFARQRTYYAYDRKIMPDENHELWMRGLIYDRESVRIVKATVRSVFIVLPFYLIISALGGYWIMKYSFRTLEDMIRTADEINAGEDLSKRIKTEGGNDEVSKLAQNFNSMLQRLEEIFELEKRYTSNVSHELRTPVTVIMSQCEIELENEQLNQEEKEAFLLIMRQGKKMSRLITQFLLFSRIENGIEKLELEDTNLSILTEEACEEYKAAVCGGSEIGMIVEEDIYASVNGEMMKRLITNLLENADKYGSHNEKIIVRLYEKPEEIVLSVEDKGIGISEEDQKKIWERFYRTEAAREYNMSAGMGLGLFMVREIAKLHHGSMSVKSEPGKGSVFIFHLPKKDF